MRSSSLAQWRMYQDANAERKSLFGSIEQIVSRKNVIGLQIQNKSPELASLLRRHEKSDSTVPGYSLLV